MIPCQYCCPDAIIGQATVHQPRFGRSLIETTDDDGILISAQESIRGPSGTIPIIQRTNVRVGLAGYGVARNTDKCERYYNDG